MPPPLDDDGDRHTSQNCTFVLIQPALYDDAATILSNLSPVLALDRRILSTEIVRSLLEHHPLRDEIQQYQRELVPLNHLSPVAAWNAQNAIARRFKSAQETFDTRMIEWTTNKTLQIATTLDEQTIRAVLTADQLGGVYIASATESPRACSTVFAAFNPSVSSTFALIKPDAVAAGHTAAVLQRITDDGFTIKRQQTFQLSRSNAETFYCEHRGKVFFDGLCDFMSGGQLVALALSKRNAVWSWRALCGPTDSTAARDAAPNSLRALFGTDGRRNAVHGSDSDASAKREIALMFDQFAPAVESTLAIIKPDAVARGLVNNIIERLAATEVHVERREELTLTMEQAQRLYAHRSTEVWFDTVCTYLSSAPIVALKLSAIGAVKLWRSMCGPDDVENAKKSDATSLRAVFGIDLLRNSVFGSRSTECAATDIAFMFDEIAPVKQTTFAMIKPDAVSAGHTDDILRRLNADGFDIIKMRRVQLTLAHAKQFYGEHIGRPFYPTLCEFMSSGPIVAMALNKDYAVTRWRTLCGPTNSETARTSSPESLRALYGLNGQKNAVHGSDSVSSARRELSLMFDEFHPDMETTFAMIKPDAVQRNHVADILKRIQSSGFDIDLIQRVTLTASQVERFYEEHRGKPFYSGLCDFMSNGTSVVMALTKRGAVLDWRRQCGPTNSETARKTAPTSLRALYGTDGRFNAVHGSDGVITAKRECDLVFGDFFPRMQTTVAIIKCDAVRNGQSDAIIACIKTAGFEIVQQTKLHITEAQAALFYQNHEGRLFMPALCKFMSSGPIIGLTIRKENAINEWRRMCGPPDSQSAKQTERFTIRAMFGTNSIENAVHSSDNEKNALRETKLIFEDFVRDIEQTLCLIKVDAVRHGQTLSIIQRLERDGFDIARKECAQWTFAQAQRFFIHFAGDVDYMDIAEYHSDQPMWILELRKKNAVESLKALCGPLDGSIARRLEPNSLRGEYGIDRLRNAVHCSLTAKDAQREIELAFKVFAGAVERTLVCIDERVIHIDAEQSVIHSLQMDGFTLIHQITAPLTEEQVNELWAHDEADDDNIAFQQHLRRLSASAIVIAEFERVNAVEMMKQITSDCGADSLSHRYGEFAVICSQSVSSAARQLELVNDDWFPAMQSTYAMIKPDAVAAGHVDNIIRAIQEEGFQILRQKQMQLSTDQVELFYEEHRARSFYTALCSFMSSGPIVALELRRQGAIKAWRAMCGPTNSTTARATAPHSLRALYGTNERQNAVHGSDSIKSAAREISFIFDESHPRPLMTVAIIKPDIIKYGTDQQLIHLIQSSGFIIVDSSRALLTDEQLSQLYADELAQPHYDSLIEYMTSDESIVLALRKVNGNVIQDWLALMGPTNPRTAQKIAPMSLRALFGTNQLQNGVHGSTDEDTAKLELALFFPHLLQPTEPS